MKYHIEFDLDLKKNPHNGLYIAVEGVDGSGKSTQIELLQKYFEEKGKTVLKTYEPNYDNVVGKMIQEILQSKISLPSELLQYLYSASRLLHNEEYVYPSLEKGEVVISHRSFWSAIPYGILDASKEDYDYTHAKVIMAAQGILSMYHQFIAPNSTIYLRVPVEVAMERLEARKRGIELYEKKQKLEKIIKGYEWLVNEFPSEIIVVDSTQSIEEIHKEIVSKLKPYEC
jgi:dTMP kinase